MGKGLGHRFIASSSSHFYNKTDFKLYSIIYLNLKLAKVSELDTDINFRVFD